MPNKPTWRDVRKAIADRGRCFYYISHNGDGEESLSRLSCDATVLRCNNGWIQATTPRHALALVLGG